VIIIHIQYHDHVHGRAELYLRDDDRSARDPEVEQLPKTVATNLPIC
jgi:hypothetical protein